MPLEDIPVLTKQGVSCSLAEYRHHLRQKGRQSEPLGKTFNSTGVSIPCLDALPPPYVERLEDDPFSKSNASQQERSEVDAVRSGPGHNEEQTGSNPGKLSLTQIGQAFRP